MMFYSALAKQDIEMNFQIPKLSIIKTRKFRENAALTQFCSLYSANQHTLSTLNINKSNEMEWIVQNIFTIILHNFCSTFWNGQYWCNFTAGSLEWSTWNALRLKCWTLTSSRHITAAVSNEEKSEINFHFRKLPLPQTSKNGKQAIGQVLYHKPGVSQGAMPICELSNGQCEIIYFKAIHHHRQNIERNKGRIVGDKNICLCVMCTSSQII